MDWQQYKKESHKLAKNKSPEYPWIWLTSEKYEYLAKCHSLYSKHVSGDEITSQEAEKWKKEICNHVGNIAWCCAMVNNSKLYFINCLEYDLSKKVFDFMTSVNIIPFDISAILSDNIEKLKKGEHETTDYMGSVQNRSA